MSAAAAQSLANANAFMATLSLFSPLLLALLVGWGGGVYYTNRKWRKKEALLDLPEGPGNQKPLADQLCDDFTSALSENPYFLNAHLVLERESQDEVDVITVFHQAWMKRFSAEPGTEELVLEKDPLVRLTVNLRTASIREESPLLAEDYKCHSWEEFRMMGVSRHLCNYLRHVPHFDLQAYRMSLIHQQQRREALAA